MENATKLIDEITKGLRPVVSIEEQMKKDCELLKSVIGGNNMMNFEHINDLLKRRGFHIVARKDYYDGVEITIREDGSLMTITVAAHPNDDPELFVKLAIAAYREKQGYLRDSIYAPRDNTPKSLTITKVIFNDPATIVFWADGTKTVVKCCEYDEFDPEKGMAMAIAKKALGGDLKPIRKWTEKYREEERKFLDSLNFQERLDALRVAATLVINNVVRNCGGK